MDDPRDRRIAELEAENAELRRRIAQLEHQLQTFLQRRKRTTAKRPRRQGTPADRRRKEHRRHPGVFRPDPPAGTTFIEHEVHPQECRHCGRGDLEATGQFDDHIVADIPEPRLEWHRYRRHFYAAYHGLDCPKQRCLVHLLRELAKLREELPGPSVRAFIQPLITLFQDAIQLGKDRDRLSPTAFQQARQAIHDRFDDLLLGCRSRHPQCLRIWRRLFRHCGELFTFLDNPQVPADNNGCERDIRSLAAARSDGGTHRADWSAAAFARIKSVIVTSLKNGLRFIHYGLETVRATLQTQPLPLPLADHH